MSTLPKKRARSRWLLWLPLLVLSTWLAWEQPGVQTSDETAVVQPPTRRPAPDAQSIDSPTAERGTANTAGRVLIPRNELYPPEQQVPRQDLFASVDWTPPPPPPPVVTPPAPIAPPLPFTFIGKRLADKQWQVFLGRGDEVLIVQEGQTLANQYRIESVAPPLMTLTYLPLGQKQTLAIGDNQ